MSAGDAVLDASGNLCLTDAGTAKLVNSSGATCPCGASCPDGMCPAGSLYRAACGGAHQYVQKFEMSGGTDAQSAGGIAFGMPIYFFDQGGYTNNFQINNPTRSKLAAHFTLSKPLTPPGPQGGGYSNIDVKTWQGIYKRITIAGNTYVFDGTIGLGVAVDSLAFTTDIDPTVWPDYPTSPNGGFQGSGDYHTFWQVMNGPTVMYENTTFGVSLYAYPSASGGSGNYQVNVSARASSTLLVKALVRIFNRYTNGSTSTYADFWEAGSPAASVGFNAIGDNTGNTDVCHGFQTTANLIDAYNNNSTIGTFTGGFVDPNGSDGVSVAEYAARNCPCAIRVTGTIYVQVRTDTGKPISTGDPPRLDPTSEDAVDAPSALGPASIDVRMVRTAPKSCGHPPAFWENIAPPSEGTILTGKLTVGDTDYPLDYTELRRVGPRLYKLAGNFTGAETFNYDGTNGDGGSGSFELFYTVDGECPTGVADVEQFAQQYGPVREGETPGQPTANSLIEPILKPSNPAVTEPFTANEIAVDEDNRENGDPACGCNESTPYAGGSSSMAMRSAARSAPAETAEPATDYASLWGEIHTYPLTQGVDGLGDLLASVRDRLGCELCQSHLDEHVAATPPDTSSVDALFAWGVDFHNAINVMLCKGGLTVEQARARWAASPAG